MCLYLSFFFLSGQHINEVKSNVTIITDFLLLGLSEERQLQIVHLLAFLTLYLTVLVGNLLIITLVTLNAHLQTPMYFFLINLSIGDLGSTSATMPKFMTNVLMNTRHISYSECVAQLLFFLFFISSDIFILAVMAYDRYVAICHPLHYMTVMKRGTCLQLAGSAWMAGFLNACLHTGTIFSMPFCSNIINQFFCEIPHLVKILCDDSYLHEMWMLLLSAALGLSCFVCIIMSYVKIFTTVSRMSSVENRQKALSTCIPHLIVVSLLLGTGILSHFMLSSSSSYNSDEVLAVIYSVLPPMMNPIIYSMRNKDVKSALWKLLYPKFPTKNMIPHVHL
ncbi:olfactory receptor 14A16-like [Tiliqua scincoides]|uniref:olfactory receptor 14A16-like n=2 Tax=Tiliqua scincoides TaxID=71010 RepID=UPI003462E3A7